MYSRINNYQKNTMSYTRNLLNPSVKRNVIKTNTSSNSSTGFNLIKAMATVRSQLLEQLSFKGNVIDIKKGCNYSVKTLLHGNTQIAVDSNESQLLICKMFPNEDVSSFFPEDEFNDMGKTTELIDFLSSGKPVNEIINLMRIFFPNSKEIGARLERLGIEPDKYFEISGQSEKLFLDSSTGWTYTQTEIENLNKSYNNVNYAKLGYTKDSVFTIDGHDYHLDDSGHLTVPPDAICIPSRVTIKK